MLASLLHGQVMPALHRLACPALARTRCEVGKLEILAHWLLDMVALAPGLP